MSGNRYPGFSLDNNLKRAIRGPAYRFIGAEDRSNGEQVPLFNAVIHNESIWVARNLEYISQRFVLDVGSVTFTYVANKKDYGYTIAYISEGMDHFISYSDGEFFLLEVDEDTYKVPRTLSYKEAEDLLEKFNTPQNPQP
jgi:hypothetical protein